MDKDKRSEEQHNVECTKLAVKVNEVLQGARLDDVACVASGLAALALQQRYSDLDERAAALMRIMETMWQAAGFTCDVTIKWQHDGDTIH